ncbi:hypothetical protein D3C72_2006380 [compost metagenome]
MGDAGFDDQIGTAGPDQFLDRIGILWDLDDRPAEPGEVLRITVADRFPHPDVRQADEIPVLADFPDIVGDVVAEVFDRIHG